MKIRVGKIIGICFAVSMIIVGSSFLVVNMIKNHQDLSAGTNATYYADRFAPVGYKWSGTSLYQYPKKPLCRIFDIERESSGSDRTPSKRFDFSIQNSAINTEYGNFKQFETFDDLEKFLLDTTRGQIEEVTEPTPRIKIKKGDPIIFFEHISQINADKERLIAENESRIPTDPLEPNDTESYNHMKSGKGLVRFKLFMSTAKGHFKVYFTFYNHPNFPETIETDVEVE